jgi:hypothetical protein
MTINNFFKTRNFRIFLVGFALTLAATSALVLEIEVPYIGWFWWSGFLICLVAMILVIRDVTGISKKSD